MLSINTNLSSLIAQNSLKTSTNKLDTAIEHMTTGAKINHAKDNAANYSIATNMSTKISAYQVAEDNCTMGLDLVQTASSSLATMSDLTSRLRALATQAQNGTYGSRSIDAINSEAQAIVQELNRIQNTTTYNGVNLLASSAKVNDTNAVAPPAGTSDFIEEITRRDTSEMTTFASVDENIAMLHGTYSISTAEELAKLAKMTNSGVISYDTEFVLANDIDLSAYSTGEGWTPIGTSDSYFLGKFDGNGYKISNLYINRPDKNFQGLFGYTHSNPIINLAVIDCNVTGKDYVGGLVGQECHPISNCYVTGSVTGNNSVGGLGGAGEYISCYAICNVTGNVMVGGLVGGINASITNCYATGNVTGNWQAGGLTGTGGKKISNSYATGNVTGNSDVGGLFGVVYSNWNTILDNAYYADTTGQTTGIGRGTYTGTAELVTMTELDELIAQGVLPKYQGYVYKNNFTLQVGVNSTNSSQINLKIAQIDISALNGLDMSDTSALSTIDEVLTAINEQQTNLGAVENRLMSALDQISVSYDNLVSSLSTIQDADIGEVSSEYIRQQILQQASATLMATANQSPSIALQLL